MHSEHEIPPASASRWSSFIAQGLYCSGLLSVLRTVSRSYDVEMRDGKLPRCRRHSGPKFVVLCYHRVGTGGLPYFSALPPRVFEAQVQFLRKHYRLVSLDGMCEELRDPRRKNGTAVAITFDDGYRDTYGTAFPILRKYGVPATIYLTVASIDTGEVAWYDRIFLALKVFPRESLELELDTTRVFRLTTPSSRVHVAAEIITHLRRLPDSYRKRICAALDSQVALPPQELKDRMLTWDQVREMHHSGIRFGSHTMSHPVVSQLAPTDLEWELGESKKLLEEKLDAAVRDFAFPFGKAEDCGTMATEWLVRLGYRSAVTTLFGCVDSHANPYALRRIQVGDEREALFAVNLSRGFLQVNHAGQGASGTGQASQDSH